MTTAIPEVGTCRRWFDWLLSNDVVAVVRSLDSEPAAWLPRDMEGNLYYLMHQPTKLAVWTSNGVYGMDIAEKPHGRVLFGGVTLLSVLRLSPGHIALWLAVKRWKRWRAWLHPAAPRPEKPSAATILAQGPHP